MKKHTLKKALLLAGMAAIMLGVAAFPPAAKAQMTKVWETGAVTGTPRFSYDGTKIISLTGAHVVVLDATNGKKLISIAAEGDGDISHDGRWLVVMNPLESSIPPKKYYNYIAIYDIAEDFKLIDSIPSESVGGTGGFGSYNVRFSPDDQKLYVLAPRWNPDQNSSEMIYKHFSIWDMKSKEELYSKKYSSSCRDLEVSSDGKYYVVGPNADPPNYEEHTRHFLVYEAATNKELYKFKSVEGDFPYNDLDFFIIKGLSKDNKLYTMSWNYNRMKIYDLNDKANLVSECKIPPNFGGGAICIMSKNYMISYRTGEDGNYKDMETSEYDPLTCTELNNFTMDYTYLVDNYNDEYYVAIFKDEGTAGQYYTGLFKYDSDIKDKAADNLLYPNPSSGIITIPLENTQLNELKLIIHDTSGKEVYASSIKGEKEIVLDVSGYAKGSYVIMLQGNGFSRTYKFVKE